MMSMTAGMQNWNALRFQKNAMRRLAKCRRPERRIANRQDKTRQSGQGTQSPPKSHLNRMQMGVCTCYCTQSSLQKYY